MSNSQTFVVEGVVVENLPNTMFRVKVTDESRPELNEQLVLCHLAGKMRIHYVKLLPGDKVRCEMAPIDLARGRIVYKIK
jgi:translation initiation factor IF-1